MHKTESNIYIWWNFVKSALLSFFVLQFLYTQLILFLFRKNLCLKRCPTFIYLFSY